MKASQHCPEAELWQALLDGTLPPDEAELCEGHLRICPACQERLDRAGACGDELLRLARQVGDLTLVPADPTLVQILERLHEKGLDRAASEPPDLYFLQPTDRPDLLGTLGPYEVQEVIGQGGMGVVLKAFEPALHRLVAIKVLAAAVAGSALARRRFTREAQAAAAVCHEHVVAVHGVHEADGLPYLVMQYVAGESLQARLDRTGPLEVAEIVRIGMQTASGLAAAHAQGLIHRDVKPANILLESEVGPASRAGPAGAARLAAPTARVKITDFGLARTADDVGLTQQGTVAGTPEYMAPEQARGEAVDHRADLFSLGAVLYACCTGVPPFRAATLLEVIRRVNDEVPAPVRALNPEVPAWLEKVVLRLLAKDPAGRFQSAAEVATLLEGYLAHLRQPATVPAPELAPTEARVATGLGVWLRRRTATALLMFLVVLGLIVWSLAGQGVVPEAVAPARQHRVYDFRTRVDDLPGMTLFGPDAELYVRTEDQGLRITLPADRPDCNNVGVELVSRIHGDFDINLGYELLAIGAPIPNPGAGVQMRLLFDPSSPMETVTRIRSPYPPQRAPRYGRVGHDGDIFAAFRLITMANGNEDGFSRGVRVRAEGSKGRLRLTRTGTRLDYLVADEGDPYQLLRSEEVGTADAETLRLFGFSGWGPVAVDLRLTDLVIDAGSLPDLTPGGISLGDMLPRRLAWSKAWLFAALVVGLVVSLPLAVWLCVWARRRARLPRRK
jgi:serine/threonine protein kinase